MAYVKRILTFLGYAYLMRVPLLAWTAILALWYGTQAGSGAEPILRGIFDVGSESSGTLATLAQFGLITVTALLAATSMGIAARLVICNAHTRFDAAMVTLTPGVELLFRLFPLSAFLAVLLTALTRSSAPLAGKLPGVVAGTALWYGLTIGAERFLSSRKWRILERVRAPKWLPKGEEGYFRDDGGARLQDRHIFAAYQFLLAFGVYAAYCLISSLDLFLFAGAHLVPTLSLVLLLLTLACWGLGGLAFYLDRYRVPLISLLVIGMLTSSLFRQSDSFYEALPRAGATQTLTAAAVLQTPLKGMERNGPVILVSTTGGGIQAAGWTARVLTGLNREVKLTGDASRNTFSRYVRLVSAVSGGSVGAMYFLSAYEDGEVPLGDERQVVASADDSSLDEVTWGLSYPDLFFAFFPVLKGIGFSDGHVHLVDGGAIFIDRGRVLEDSWRNRLPASQSDATLTGWKRDASNGVRPGVLFNSTLVETGERYLLATAGFSEQNDAAAGQPASQIGRVEFLKRYPQTDLRIRTAARLSATFPIVSPAARILRNDYDPNMSHSNEGGFYLSEPHAVDGGYYDNFGMASLLDWLDTGLRSLPAQERNTLQIMLVEIRASPTDEQDTPPPSYGALFQLANPLLTLWNVRGTGQLSHNALDEGLVERLYTPNVCNTVFEFKNTDQRGSRRAEPLNWHLTKTDIEGLDKAWNDSEAIRFNVDRVQRFLEAKQCPQ